MESNNKDYSSMYYNSSNTNPNDLEELYKSYETYYNEYLNNMISIQNEQHSTMDSDTVSSNPSTPNAENNNFDQEYTNIPPISLDSHTEAYNNDYNYFKSLYPSVCKRILKEIEEECDKLEHEGSAMFDEYPDKVFFGNIINKIYNKLKDLDKDNPELQTEELSYNPLVPTVPYRRCNGFPCAPSPLFSDYTYYGRPNWLRSLIELMLYNEMIYRRNRYRCHKRWFF